MHSYRTCHYTLCRLNTQNRDGCQTRPSRRGEDRWDVGQLSDREFLIRTVACCLECSLHKQDSRLCHKDVFELSSPFPIIPL